MLSLVGYTNAGKSTLFNRVTSSEVYAADKLFATLDPTLARVDIEHLGPVLFADTVGFILIYQRLSWKLSKPPLKRRPTPVCCSTWSMSRPPTGMT